MKCNSCGIEIPPIFSNSLKTNVCPACSGPIMQSDVQELIDGLASAMEKMPNSPQGIACWLASNYKMIKINDYDPIDKFYDKNSPSSSPQHQQSSQQSNIIKNSDGTIKGSQAKLHDFFARAGVKPEYVDQSSTDLMRQKAYERNNDLPSQPQSSGGGGGGGGFSQLDPVEKMMLTGGGGGGSMSPEELETITSMVSNTNYGDDNFYYQKLEQDKFARQNIILGGGAVSKSGKPAGFRRAD